MGTESIQAVGICLKNYMRTETRGLADWLDHSTSNFFQFTKTEQDTFGEICYIIGFILLHFPCDWDIFYFG